jgi:hypothetical protein
MRLSSKLTTRFARLRATAPGRRPSWITATGVACVLAASAACGTPALATAEGSSASHCGPGDRGRVLSAALLLQLSRAQVADKLKEGGLTIGTRYGTKAYRVTYCTVSSSQQPVIASGLLVLPQGRRGTLSLVSYDHSTVARKDDAPSDLKTTESRLVPILFATDGFAVAAPDYLGLGLGPGLHPYMLASSEASATVDMLTAAGRVSAQHQARLSHKIFLTGFSQGGQAAMATGQALQRNRSPWKVAALAPISGPYDLDAEFPAMFDANRVDPHRAAGYTAYILTAWNRLYHLYTNPRDVFTAPTAGKINTLFDGKHEFDAIGAALPPVNGLLQPAWRTLIEHPAGRLAAAIRANQVCHWSPREPTRLYASPGDHDVVFANAQTCLREIEDMGGRAQIEDMGTVDHLGSALASLPLVRAWFAQLAT